MRFWAQNETYKWLASEQQVKPPSGLPVATDIFLTLFCDLALAIRTIRADMLSLR